MISLIDIGSIDLCVLCVFVVRSTPSLGEMYLRIHFTHQSWESREVTSSLKNVKLVTTDEVLVELLNFMSVRGANRKRRTVEFIDDLLQNPGSSRLCVIIFAYVR